MPASPTPTSARATDDRARPIPLLRPADLRRTTADPDPRRADLARHLDNAIRAESRRFSIRGFGLTVILTIAWIAALVFIHSARLARLPGVGITTFFGGLLLVSLAASADARRRIASQLAATAVAEGICGGCCYSLEGIPAEPDACIVCPECGAAWKQTRITRPHWLYPARALHRNPGRIVRFLTLTPNSADLLSPDDRGRFVPIPDSRLRLLPHARRDALGRDRTRRLVKRLRRLGRARRILLTCLPASIGILIGWGIINALRDGRRDVAAVMAFPFAFMAVLTPAILFGHGFISTRRAARILVADGLCASCTSELAGAVPADDGLVVCPDCGAAWRPTPAIDRPS